VPLRGNERQITIEMPGQMSIVYDFSTFGENSLNVLIGYSTIAEQKLFRLEWKYPDVKVFEEQLHVFNKNFRAIFSEFNQLVDTEIKEIRSERKEKLKDRNNALIKQFTTTI
jgi:chloramphenicol O-acetyltransferase